MSHHRYVLMIGLAGIIAWGAFALVINFFNPYAGLALPLGLGFISLFVALTSTFSVIGFYFRLWFFKNEIFYKHINISFRQGVFLSFVAVTCLALQLIKVLRWWSGLLVVAIAVLLEFYFSSRDSNSG